MKENSNSFFPFLLLQGFFAISAWVDLTSSIQHRCLSDTVILQGKSKETTGDKTSQAEKEAGRKNRSILSLGLEVEQSFGIAKKKSRNRQGCSSAIPQHPLSSYMSETLNWEHSRLQSHSWLVAVIFKTGIKIHNNQSF